MGYNHRKPRKVRQSIKLRWKKTKRVSPYEKKTIQEFAVDGNQLVDAPLQSWEGVGTWAMLAGPNKPP